MGLKYFDAIGLDQSVIDAYFTGTHSQISGVNINDIAKGDYCKAQVSLQQPRHLKNNTRCWGRICSKNSRRRSCWTYNTISSLQHAVRGNAQDKYNAYAHEINEQDKRLLTIRGLMKLKTQRR